MSLYLTPKPEDYTTEAERRRLELLKLRQQHYAALLAGCKTEAQLRWLLGKLREARETE